jgi:hypothetical protein
LAHHLSVSIANPYVPPAAARIAAVGAVVADVRKGNDCLMVFSSFFKNQIDF